MGYAMGYAIGWAMGYAIGYAIGYAMGGQWAGRRGSGQAVLWQDSARERGSASPEVSSPGLAPAVVPKQLSGRRAAGYLGP